MAKKLRGRPKTTVLINYPLLSQIRLRKGITQSHIAEVLGYTPSRVSQFEIGHMGGVPLDALKVIAQILKIDYKILLIKEPNHETKTLKN